MDLQVLVFEHQRSGDNGEDVFLICLPILQQFRIKDSKVLQKVLLKAYYSFLQSGDALAELKTGKVYRKENEILDGIESIGLDSALMKKIQALRTSESASEQETLHDLYERFMEMIVEAAEIADQA